MTRFSIATIGLLSFFSVSVFASPGSEFEDQFRDMYQTYRSALFMTNTGKQQESAATMGKLSERWMALLSNYSESPPPQFEDDQQWDVTLAAVSGSVELAMNAVKSKDLPKAHSTLEAIRDEFSSLHARNDISTFSDRMNAYHAAMERVLEMDLSNLDSMQVQSVLERAAVLSYLADEIVRRPPPDAVDGLKYAGLISALEVSVNDLLAAARSGEQASLKAAISKLKAPYSKLFLKFG